jgi:hypothetical protein
LGSPFWNSDNGSHKSTLYNVPIAIDPLGLKATKNARVVSIPSPDDPSGGGTPTGNAWNPTSRAATCIAPKCTPQFKITGYRFTATTAGTPPVVVAPAPTCSTTPTTAPASFLFATEDGTIVGWSSTLFPATPAGLAACKAAAAAVPIGTVNPNVTPNNTGIIAVDNSARGQGVGTGKGKGKGLGAIYKGLAIATDASGTTFLYATNFRRGTVEIYDGTFALINSFSDKDAEKKGYAPFNVGVINSKLFVTFAVQDKDRTDDVAGAGNGIVDTFDLAGDNLKRFAEGGDLNSPWGLALAPATFGDRGGKLWIGNFGDGKINAFDPVTGGTSQAVNLSTGKPIVIDGLWALLFGNDGNGGSSQTLYFNAGPNDEADGLFGALRPSP